MIADLEPFRTIRIVNAGNFHQLLIFMLVAQLVQHRGQLAALDGKAYFAIGLDRVEQGSADRLAELGSNAGVAGYCGCGMGHYTITAVKPLVVSLSNHASSP